MKEAVKGGKVVSWKAGRWGGWASKIKLAKVFTFTHHRSLLPHTRVFTKKNTSASAERRKRWKRMGRWERWKGWGN